MKRRAWKKNPEKRANVLYPFLILTRVLQRVGANLCLWNFVSSRTDELPLLLLGRRGFDLLRLWLARRHDQGCWNRHLISRSAGPVKSLSASCCYCPKDADLQ